MGFVFPSSLFQGVQLAGAWHEKWQAKNRGKARGERKFYHFLSPYFSPIFFTLRFSLSIFPSAPQLTEHLKEAISPDDKLVALHGQQEGPKTYCCFYTQV